jgi:hypothetical protein
MARMTSLLPHESRTSTDATDTAVRGVGRTSGELQSDLVHRRPLVLLATLAGAAAAASTLVVCLAVGVLGWFLTDAGAHGAPRDALRAGAVGWLMAHGSGATVRGTLVSVVPWGITLICAWTVVRFGLRVGDSVSGLGPDADALGDGERDWTVPTATGLFSVGYLLTLVATHTLASTVPTQPDLSRAVVGALGLTFVLGGASIAVGSGRAAVWLDQLPTPVLVAAACCRRILTTWLLVAALVLAVGFVVDLSTATNVMSQLGTTSASTALFALLTVLVVPNAVVFSGSYLIGPGFAVGVGTLVSPTAVVVGPLPLFPLLAALPDSGPTPSWAPWLMLLAPVVAAHGTARALARYPSVRWDEGGLRGALGGIAAGVVFGLLAGLVGGAVGPGRMADVGPLAFATLTHAVTVFGIGGLLGGLFATWRHRRARLAELADLADG